MNDVAPGTLARTTPPSRHRFHFLDALRGIAAIVVVLYHLPLYLTPPIHFAKGFLAVDFFFVLSGFVIAFSYEARLQQGLSGAAFFAARIIRLYPLYLIGSVAGLSCAWATGALRSLTITAAAGQTAALLCMFPLVGRHLPNYPFNPPAWSLFQEIVANVGYMLLVRKRLATNAILGGLAIASCCTLLLYVLHGAPDLDMHVNRYSLFVGLQRVTYSFCAGVLIERLYRRRAARPTRRYGWPLAIAITAMLLVAMLSTGTGRLSVLLQWLVVTAVLPPLVYFGALVQLPHATDRACAALGELSFPLYMIHAWVMRAVQTPAAESCSLAHPAARIWTIPAVAFYAAAAWWIGRHVDAPLRRAFTHAYNALQKPIEHNG